MSIDSFFLQVLTVMAILAIVVAVLLGYVTSKSNGSLTKALSRIIKSEAINGIVTVVVAVIVGGLLIGTFVYTEQAEARQVRNSLLSAVDTVVTNPLRWEELTPADRAELSTYRKALLGIPQQTDFPKQIDWPERPDILLSLSVDVV